MIRRLVPIVTAIALAISGGVLATPASATGPVVDQQSPAGAGGLWVGPATTTAQPFVAQSTGSLTSVKVTVGHSEWVAPTNLTVAIHGTTDGVLQSSALRSVTLGQQYLASTFVNRTAEVEAIFDPALTVTAGSTYAIVLSTTDTNPSGWAYTWKSGNYCAPFHYTLNSTDPGATWVSAQGGVNFTTYVNGVAAPLASYPAPIVMALPGHDRATVNVAQCSGTGTYVDRQWTRVEYRVGSGEWTTALQGVPAVRVTHPAESFVVTGLTDGVPATIAVRVTNDANGTSAVSTATVTPTAQRPDAPSNLAVLVPGDGQALIDFDEGSDNGSPITRYEYQLDLTGPWIPVTDGGTEAPVTVSGLTNGTETWVNLRAVNAVGAGPAAAYAVRTIAGAPEAPAALVVTPGNNSVSVSFTPCLPGASPITGYQSFSPGIGEFFNSSSPVTGSPFVITHRDPALPLTNGDTFTVRIRAINALTNEGVASEEVTVVVGAGQPVVSGEQTRCASAPAPSGGDSGGGGGEAIVEAPAAPAPTPTPTPTPTATPAAPAPAAPSAPVSNVVLQTTAPVFVPPKVTTPVGGGVVLVPSKVADSAPVDKLRSAPTTSLATAPLLVAPLGDPIKLQPTGFTPGISYTIRMTVGNKVVVLGTVTPDANGKLRLPVVMASRLGDAVISIAPPTGKPALIKLRYRSAR